MTEHKSNLAASVRARLQNRARADNVNFQQILTRFALERLLYRLSISRHRDQFLLKGALLFDLWFHEPHRPTQDVDFLGYGSDDLVRIADVFRDICAVKVQDGIDFHPASVRAGEIRLAANYGGVRVNLLGTLAGARCPVQADIGFGDAVTPGPEDTVYPTLLPDLPAASLRVYPKYTVVAEKFHAIVQLGIENSRMKDFFDLWILTREPHLDSSILRQAIAATFDRRGTAVPTVTPLGLSDEFISDRLKQSQWQGFASKNQIQVPPLDQVITHLRKYFASMRITAKPKSAVRDGGSAG